MLQSKLITVDSRIQKPHTSSDGTLCNNCEQLKAADYYRKVLHLSYGMNSEQSRLLKRLLFPLFRTNQEFERNKKINSVDFCNCD